MMNKLAIWSACSLTFFLYTCKTDLKYNAFYPGQVWEDNNGVHINAHGGGMLLHKGIYYWYGEHKVATSIGNSAQVGVHVYSSSDLYNWIDEGIALNVIENDTLHDITKGCILERPKVIYNEKSKTFVMWFHLERKGTSYSSARSGVATSSSPLGPFTFVKSVRPNKEQWPINVLDIHKINKESEKNNHDFTGGSLPTHTDSINILGRDFKTGQMARDMTLFVDDDGKAYHIFASEENSTLHISELTDDYLDYTGKYMRVFIDRFMEAPAIFKQNGKYYFIGSGCTGWEPNAARSAVSESIWGPWVELGNPCTGPDSQFTFHSQSTYVLPAPGTKNGLIFMADRWQPNNPIDGTYIWLPITFDGEKPVIEWFDQWNMNYFNP